MIRECNKNFIELELPQPILLQLPVTMRFLQAWMTSPSSHRWWYAGMSSYAYNLLWPDYQKSSRQGHTGCKMTAHPCLGQVDQERVSRDLWWVAMRSRRWKLSRMVLNESQIPRANESCWRWLELMILRVAAQHWYVALGLVIHGPWHLCIVGWNDVCEEVCEQ